YAWGGVDNQGSNTAHDGSISVFKKATSSSFDTAFEFVDINGDGRPDRVMTNSQTFANWLVQTNLGFPATNTFSASQAWTLMSSNPPDIFKITNDASGGVSWMLTELLDMNGDGLPDRLIIDPNSTSRFIQFNTNGGFTTNLPLDQFGGTLYTYNLFAGNT